MESQYSEAQIISAIKHLNSTKNSVKKYQKTEKGRLAQSIANKKYYAKKKARARQKKIDAFNKELNERIQLITNELINKYL